MKHSKLYYLGDAVLGLAGLVGIVPVMMLVVWIIDGGGFKLGFTFLLFGVSAVLFVIGGYMITRAKAQEQPKSCPRCGNRMVNVIRVRRSTLPMYFCECDKCLMRSAYSRRRSGAIWDWNRTKSIDKR